LFRISKFKFIAKMLLQSRNCIFYTIVIEITNNHYMKDINLNFITEIILDMVQ